MFWPGTPGPVFFVASRGHHADIGGLTPGSMPPMSQCLADEGACIYSFKLVQNGVFDESGKLLGGGGRWGQGDVARLETH